MKKFFLSGFIALCMSFGWVAFAAEAATITCGDADEIEVSFDANASESVKKPVVLQACFNHIRSESQAGRALKAEFDSYQLQQDFSYTGVFCWCRGTASNQNLAITPTMQENSAACTQHCQGVGSTVANVDNTYVQRDNYCWCQEYSSANQTTCRNHRVRPGSSANTYEPISTGEQCNQYCPTLMYNNDPSKKGVSKHFERTYHSAYENTADCAAAAAPTGGTTPARAPSTPAPTVRLFNPMAGASTVVDIVNRFIKILMGLVGAGALLMFIYGGIKWMTAGGDAKNVGEAQTILKNSTLGLLLLIFAYSIVSTFFSVLT